MMSQVVLPNGSRVKDLRHALQHGLEREPDLSTRDGLVVPQRVDVEVPVGVGKELIGFGKHLYKITSVCFFTSKLIHRLIV